MKTATTTKRNFSKIDHSGTDPNRYASVSNHDEAKSFLGDAKNMFGYTPNISTIERIAMVAAGSYLLYKALSSKKKSIAQGIAGGTMLARGISGYCPIYDAVEKSGKLSGQNVNIRTKVVVDKTPEQAYNEWRDLSNLPRFMKHLSSVDEIDHLRSEWTAKGPAGIGSLKWKAEILMQEPGQVLSWHSLPGSAIDNAGKVTFEDIGNGQTEIDVTISYHAPLGIAGEAAAKLLNPLFEKMVQQDIENFRERIDKANAITV
ncbi:SRPBCC family protein [Flavobacterium agri]|nr:SRPBCC family protein [Flavobacterium agri]